MGAGRREHAAHEPLISQATLADVPLIGLSLRAAHLPGNAGGRSIDQAILSIALPPGRNTLQIPYHNRMLSLFWIVYATYALLAA